MNTTQPLRVALWITCLADWMRPRVAEATVNILEAFGCEVVVPEAQTCCGQPAYNSGDRASAMAVAKHSLALLTEFDYIVLPSGSCAGMMTKHYPELFRDQPESLRQVTALTPKVFELTQFLVNVLQVHDETRYPEWPTHLITTNTPTPTLTYHDSCSGLRELGIKSEPRLLIARMQAERAKLGLSEKTLPLTGEEDCCGFGGAFAAKYGDISTTIAGRKCDNIANTQADAVVLGDLGCMLNIEGKLRDQGRATRVLHIAEYIAGI